MQVKCGSRGTRSWKAITFVLGCGLALLPVQNVAVAEDSVVKLNQSQSTGKRINLGLSKSLVVDLPSDAYDILVANPTVADAVTRTARRIYLFGKQVGQTNVFVFGPNGEQLASFDLVIERDVAGLEDSLRKYIPDSDIKVELMNDNVILTGTVQTPLDAKRASDLANLLVSGGEATTGQYALTASGQGGSNGGGGSDVAISDPDEARQRSKIVNLIQIAGDDQVTLKVTVAEVSRSVMKQLGVNMIASTKSDGILFSSENIASLVGKALTSSGASIPVSIGSTSINSYLNAMESAGVMKTLAEPSLTAVSGEQATFKVGGEYNLITGQSIEENSVTGAERSSYEITKVEYGIGLEFVPVVLSPGRISLKVRTSVSEPTMEGSVSLSSGGDPLRNKTFGPATNLISLRKRLADTTVELPSGGSMMIAGLMRDENRAAISGLPGMSKIPVLGTLFRSREFVRNESELVIIITPYLVRPVARTALARPDDNLNPASDAAGIFLGKVNRVYGTKEARLPDGRYEGNVGYIYK
ncbi:MULTISPECIES: type II and III secretion system protein family protein [Phyllobacterium]|uniref:Pilus assembly protein CpaC n=1 Tax=Phyllobacterium sophorae TaxID=1520277 RepID=A0A2P7BCM8_9HYPH|nr:MULTISPECIES: type II and III secretion system protein family protein [Phyllobacterium]PSH64228.1 pilus assembly protein CpaC [Phyllobacterium sophorae]UXN63022.1 type II and III secretion system protein family protein [Phyllobacterium sp. A18/5-2]